MPRRHWLDPLARRVLIATGQIKAPAGAASERPKAAAATGRPGAAADPRQQLTSGPRPDRAAAFSNRSVVRSGALAPGAPGQAAGMADGANGADGTTDADLANNADLANTADLANEADLANWSEEANATWADRAPWVDQAVRADEPDEVVERELLALKLRHNPGLRLRTEAEVRHAAALGWRLEVNRATAADWLRLPGCRADQVDRLLRLQGHGVQLSGPEDLLLQLPEARELVPLWQPLLDFCWYAPPTAAVSPPPAVEVNRAAAAALASLPGMTEERCGRLQGERRRAPFRDLADLQERLQLPPALIEQWIGRLSFVPPISGPVLPPAVRRPPR